MHRRVIDQIRAARRTVIVSLVALGCLAFVAAAQADLVPLEPYARYEPQKVCSPSAKPGTLAMARWVVATQGGRFGSISRSCAGSSTSEHKEGRAFDWTLNARSAADRARAARFLALLTRTGPSGEAAELARRMGVMYVIWNDRIYAAYDQFRPRAYRSSSCRKLKRCSRTLRHRDHMHISLTRAGGQGATSWYVGRVPGAKPPAPPPTLPPAPTPPPDPTPTPQPASTG